MQLLGLKRVAEVFNQFTQEKLTDMKLKLNKTEQANYWKNIILQARKEAWFSGYCNKLLGLKPGQFSTFICCEIVLLLFGWIRLNWNTWMIGERNGQHIFLKLNCLVVMKQNDRTRALVARYLYSQQAVNMNKLVCRTKLQTSFHSTDISANQRLDWNTNRGAPQPMAPVCTTVICCFYEMPKQQRQCMKANQ